ncbi:MAG: SRPBCC domain-containing protein [Propionicimonas sp.]|nr:SRPBCC domain-containing protein [Propionicimonas sp.]
MTDQSAGETLANSEGTTVTVRRSVSQPPKSVWKLLVTREGAEALLGPGGELGDKGDSWHAEDGTYGVIRSFHPLEQIRFSWHAAEEAPKTLVDVHLLPGADGDTIVEICHDHIPAYFDAAAISRRWESALAKLADAANLAIVVN